jgi:hypothetical protein
MKKNVKRAGAILLIAASVVATIFVGTPRNSYGYVKMADNCGDLENTDCCTFLNGKSCIQCDEDNCGSS